VANLQIKNVDDDVYADLKALAASENRSVSQQVLCLVKGYLSRRHHSDHTKTPAEVLLDLSGSWEDVKGRHLLRSQPAIVTGIFSSRRMCNPLFGIDDLLFIYDHGRAIVNK